MKEENLNQGTSINFKLLLPFHPETELKHSPFSRTPLQPLNKHNRKKGI